MVAMDIPKLLTVAMLATLTVVQEVKGENATNLTIRPWLRVCAGGGLGMGNSILLDGGQCPGGYMFQKPFSAGCVCGNGIWVLKAGYCDAGAKTFILFADGNNCYNIKGEFRWIRYIGHPERARLDSHYIISEYWDYLEQLGVSGPSSYIGSNIVWSMATGDAPVNVYLPEERICFRSDWRPLGNNPEVTGNPYVRVGRTKPDSSEQSFQADPHQAQRLSYCPYFAREESTHWFYPGGLLEASSTGSIFHAEPTPDVHGNCHLRCSNGPPWSDEPVTTEKPEVEPKLDENGLAFYPWSGEDSFAKQMEDLVGTNETANSTDPQMCQPDPEASREMDLQTLRMIRTQAAFALKQVKSPIPEIREFQYLRKARQITAQKCPALPEALVKGFIRMFRLALNESVDNHPYREAGVNGSHQRILTALDSCLNGTGGPERNMSFIFDESCPPMTTGLQYTPEGEENPRNCSGRIPKHLRFKSCDLDIVMEATWKIILFTHYFCARHFVNVTQDASEFYVAMERLYSPDLLMRYYNPGNSYTGLQFAFQVYDLDKFMRDLERCVACARDISQYRAWLKRPKNLKMCPMNGPGQSENEYNFDIGGYKGLRKNPKYLPYHEIKGREYQCYSGWSDGLYTRPRIPVKKSCGLGLHVVGQTVTFA